MSLLLLYILIEISYNSYAVTETNISKGLVAVTEFLTTYTSYAMTETKLQANIFQWHWNTFPGQRGQLFHVNQKSRNAIEGNRMKAMGVVAGVSDLILIQQGRVSFIELKTDVGLQRPVQKHFQLLVEAMGHPYQIIRSLDEFKKLF